MPPKQICKFYQKGNCRNGNRCNFLHADPDVEDIPNRVTSASQFMNLDPSVIAKDIRQDLDEYKQFQMNPALTAYGTGEFAINNLIAGRDVSPEELRIQYMEAQLNNNLNEYNSSIELKKKDMEYCINEVRKKDTLAARYQQVGITHRDTMKPFIDKTVEQSMAELQKTVGSNVNGFGGTSGAFGSSGFGLNSNPFGSNANPFGSAASKPSGFGTSGFGSSGFGNNNNGSGAFGLMGASSANTISAPAASTNPGFGNSGFGSAGFGSSAISGAFGSQKTTSGFGSAGFGLSGSSAFGSGTGAFGTQSNANPLGSNNVTTTANTGAGGFGINTTTSAFGSSGFGASKPNNASGFGSSGFGSSGFGLSGFGSTTSSAFGQQPNPASNAVSKTPSAFGASPSSFGTTTTNTPSAFGSATATANTNQNSTAANPFGSTTQSAFGQPAQPATSGFGGFGQTSAASGQKSSAFGGFASSTTTPAFGASNNSMQPSTNGASVGSTSQFGGTQAANNSAAKSLDKFDPEIAKVFLATRFELGKVPEVVPPPQVC